MTTHENIVFKADNLTAIFSFDNVKTENIETLFSRFNTLNLKCMVRDTKYFVITLAVLKVGICPDSACHFVR